MHHLTDVQWFRATIVAERVTRQPPTKDDPRRPPTGLGPDESLALLTRVSGQLIAAVTGDASHQATAVWTWAPDDQTIGFVTRHQMQEAAVHDFDASDAAGIQWSIDPMVAADCVEEFLTYSICRPADPAPAGTEPLGEPIRLVATDTGTAWSVVDGSQPGTLELVGSSSTRGLAVEAPAGELLLWLYGRAEIAAASAELVCRFRALIWTT